jgi:hypothetical protein
MQLQKHDAENGKQLVADPSLDAASAQARKLTGGGQLLNRIIETKELKFTFGRLSEKTRSKIFGIEEQRLKGKGV